MCVMKTLQPNKSTITSRPNHAKNDVLYALDNMIKGRCRQQKVKIMIYLESENVLQIIPTISWENIKTINHRVEQILTINNMVQEQFNFSTAI